MPDSGPFAEPTNFDFDCDSSDTAGVEGLSPSFSGFDLVSSLGLTPDLPSTANDWPMSAVSSSSLGHVGSSAFKKAPTADSVLRMARKANDSAAPASVLSLKMYTDPHPAHKCDMRLLNGELSPTGLGLDGAAFHPDGTPAAATWDVPGSGMKLYGVFELLLPKRRNSPPRLLVRLTLLPAGLASANLDGLASFGYGCSTFFGGDAVVMMRDTVVMTSERRFVGPALFVDKAKVAELKLAGVSL